MKKKIAQLFVSLMFLGALTVVRAQTQVQIGPYGNLHIGPYGNLVGLTDTQGKDVFGQIREGFAIAYQVKNPKGVNGDRLLYALGDQLISGLMVEKKTSSTRVVATRAEALEISRTLTWDEKSNTLKSYITLTNIGAGEIAVTGIELELDNRLLGVLIGEHPAKDLHLLLAVPAARTQALPDAVRAWAGVDCEICPVPACGVRCSLGQAKAVFREPNGSKSAWDDDLFAARLPQFSGSLFCLTWPASSLVNPTLKRGEKISVYSWFVLGR